VPFNDYAEFSEECFLEISPFFASIPRVNQDSSRRKPRSEALDDISDQFAVLAGAEFDFFIRRNLNGDEILDTRASVARG
jgi:hypothetical protein